MLDYAAFDMVHLWAFFSLVLSITLVKAVGLWGQCGGFILLSYECISDNMQEDKDTQGPPSGPSPL